MKEQFLNLSGLTELVSYIKLCIAQHKVIIPRASFSLFPETGDENNIYIDTSNNSIYRWSDADKKFVLLAKPPRSISISEGKNNGQITLKVDEIESNASVHGLKSAAFSEANSFATAAQGAKADSAVQSITIAPGTNNGTVKITVNGVTTDNIKVAGLGSAAFYDSEFFALASHSHTKDEVGLGNVDNTADKDKSVKYAESSGAVAWGNITGKPSSFPPQDHNHNSLYYQKSEVDSKLSGKSDTGHTHVQFIQETKFSNGTYSDPLKDTSVAIKASGGIAADLIYEGGSTLANKYQAKGSYAAADHTHNYAGASESGGAAYNAINLLNATPTLSTGIESNEISIKTNDNGSLNEFIGGDYASIRSALDFRWYDSHWQIGNLRSGNRESYGFGFAFSPDGTSYTKLIYIDTNGYIHGNLSGYATSALSVPWSGIADKPSTYSPTAHTHLISDVSSLQDQLNSKLSLSGGTITGKIKWSGDNALPQFDGTPNYLLGIDAFSKGGTMKWQEVGAIRVGSAGSADLATMSMYPQGFSNRLSSQTWGNQNGSFITDWSTTNGGEISFRENVNQLNVIIDGYYYQNEGRYKVLDEDNFRNYALPYTGGTMAGTAFIAWQDSGNWGISNEGVTFPIKRGGLIWYGQSDSAALYSVETASDNLELYLEFQDDNSNGLSVVNATGIVKARISANGDITAASFTGTLYGTASNANTLGGYGGSATATANTYVLRDSNNQAFFHYINSDTQNNENPGISQIITTSGDNYYRKSSLSHLKSSLGEMTPASGSKYYVRVYNSSSINGSPTLTFNDLAKQHAAVAMIQGAEGNPLGTAKWAHGISLAWTDGNNDNWVSQIALNVSDGSGMYYRTTQGSIVSKEWTTLLDSNNYGNYALPLSGGTMNGSLYFSGMGYNNGIYAGPNDNANGPGGGLNNLVISSWYGVSFTTSCSSQTYTGKTAVGIDCRNGIVNAARFDGLLNGTAENAKYLSTYAVDDTDDLSCIKTAFSSIPKSVATAVRLQHGAHSMALGWFLDGYDFDHAHGGWFISDYGTPSWIGVNNGSWYSCQFITSNNIGSQSVNYANNSGALGGCIADFDTQNNSDTWLLVINNGKIQHRLATDFASSSHTHAYLPLSGGTFTGNIEFTNTTSGYFSIGGTIGDNDYWRVGGGATGSNAGYLEIATADDGNEPIYVRQYSSGKFVTLARTATLLDGSGNTSFPGTVTASSFKGNVSGTATNSEYIGNDNQYMRFHWSGQGGQPTWLWGGNEAGNMYVYNPSGFSVNYANSAGSANSVAWDNVSGKPSTFAPSSHTHDYITSSYRLTAGTTANRAAGIRQYEIYNNGYPFTYGNVLQLTGSNGVSQLAMQWHGVGLSYRSAPDTSTTFTDWATILTSANYTSYAATASHTHSYTNITNRPTLIKAVSANGYWGMADHDGSDSNWIRTTSSGLIPYQSGSAGGGHCSIGTSSWYFSGAYIDTVNCVNTNASGYLQANGLINTYFEYQSVRSGTTRDWRFGSVCGTGDENWFGFYDTTYGYHGGWYGPTHSFRANGEIISTNPNAFRAVYGNYGFIIRNDGANIYFLTTDSGNPYGSWNNNYTILYPGSGQWAMKKQSGDAMVTDWGTPVLSDTTARVYSLSYNGSSYLKVRIGSSATYHCTFSNSDIRLKENVKDTEVTNALNVINSMQLRQFDWKKEHRHQKIGFVADEIEQFDPDLTQGGGTDENGNIDIKSIDTLYMLGYVVKSIQELSSEVTSLRQENKLLKQKLNMK